jgi:alpha-tubulin suppressor-like RCC1 family protein
MRLSASLAHAALLSWVALSACTPGPVELFIDLKTDLVPGVEMTRTRVELFEHLPAAEEEAPEQWRRVRKAMRGEPFIDGIRAAELSGLSPGTYHVRARLLDAAHEPVLQRIATITLRDTSVFTITLTRDCRGVTCPQDDPVLTACLGGLCNDPRCTEESPEYCIPTCTDVCMPGAPCTSARCEGGVCLHAESPGACEASEWCNPDVGCEPLPSGVFAGSVSACAIRPDTSAACWGENSTGQLGDGTTTRRSSPATVRGLAGVTELALSQEASCALRDDGSVWCWGYNGLGQLGDGTFTGRLDPTPVTSLSGVVDLSAGRFHTCALLDDGTVWCWGDNYGGQLGDGTFEMRNLPVRVQGIATIATAVVVGNQAGHSCAVLADTTAACWGDNDFGQVGDGTTTDQPTAVPVLGVSGVVRLAPGELHTCAIVDDGTVRCWGANYAGQLGDGTTMDRATAAEVTPLAGMVALSAGVFHACGHGTDSILRCWGGNNYGQLGDTTTIDRLVPSAVVGLPPVLSFTSGAVFGCAVLDDLSISCWGHNSSGELGNGTETRALMPTSVIDWP